MRCLHDALADYVLVRRALGSQFREPAQTLSHFVEFLEREGQDFITTNLALRWACESKGVQRATWSRRLSMVRRFAHWMRCFDSRTEVPPTHLLHVRHRRATPYIFTESEITKLMLEASALHPSKGLRALTYPTLIGLLWATGLRPGEALALDQSDVNLESGVLAVRNSKFGKSRFVPLSESSHRALAHYAERRDALCPSPQSPAFLITEDGGRVSGCAARRTFAKLCYRIGLRAAPVGRRIGRGPRLQDLRHSFATWRLVEWYRAGSDVRLEVPKLASYLGHIDSSQTYWYIQAVPELLQLATEQLIEQREQGGAG